MPSELTQEWTDSLRSMDAFLMSCGADTFLAERLELSKLREISLNDEVAMESKIKRVRAIMLASLPISGVSLGSNGRLSFEKEKENEPHTATSRGHLTDAHMVNCDPSASPFSTPEYARATVTLVGAKSNEFGGMDVKEKERSIPNLPF